jgi:hypothetical protein
MPNAGDLIRASDNLVRVGCRVRRAAAQSINTGTATSLSWDTEDEDIGDFITVTSTTITIPAGYDGIYAITAKASGPFSEGGGSRDFITIEVTSSLTGLPTNFRSAAEGAAEDMMDVCAVVPLAAGDSFVVQVFHQTGSAVNFTGFCSCYRLGV